MRIFRRTEFHGLVVATPQDLTWAGGSLKRRQDNGSTTDEPSLPSSLKSIPAESAPTLAPDLPNDAVVPSAAATSNGSGLLGLSLGLLPTAAAAAAASSTPSPAAAAAASSAAPGGGLLGLGVGSGVGGLLGGASTSTEASTSAAPTSVAAAPSSVPPTIVAPAPVTSVQPNSSGVLSSSPPSATNAIPAVTLPTTASQVALSSALVSAQPDTTAPVAQSSSAVVPLQQSTSEAVVIPAQSSSLDVISNKASTSSISAAAQISSVASLKSSATGKEVTLTSKDGTSQVTYLSTISPTAAADLNGPTLATSMVTSVTKTGSVPGVTTETTGSGIVVTETLKPSNGISAGTTAGVIVGAAAGGLIIAALILLIVRKFIRARRIAKAESPPSSPLLNASNPPLSPMPPLRIEVGMHQRMRSNESDFWVSGQGSSVNEKEIDGHGYPMPISPLPRLPESQWETDDAREGNGGNGGFKFFPSVDRSGEGKQVVPKDF